MANASGYAAYQQICGTRTPRGVASDIRSWFFRAERIQGPTPAGVWMVLFRATEGGRFVLFTTTRRIVSLARRAYAAGLTPGDVEGLLYRPTYENITLLRKAEELVYWGPGGFVRPA